MCKLAVPSAFNCPTNCGSRSIEDDLLASRGWLDGAKRDIVVIFIVLDLLILMRAQGYVLLMRYVAE